MNINSLLKAYRAEAIVAPFRIVKHGTTDDAVIQGAAATDLLIGVSTDVAAAAGQIMDVVKTGLTNIEFGGAVTRGQPLTSDSVGRAVAAAPGAGTNNRIIGFAECSGVLGDIGQVYLSPGVMQG